MEHLKAGEWAEFGTEFDAMKKDLEALVAEEAKESP
jgi:hypothetical protein